ncbi:MAG TPA: hypothetical protein VNN18_04925 [Candidatus Xenobia bacterium]|nr:hypothetical protein [Candidatus Xenobia bacterium]
MKAKTLKRLAAASSLFGLLAAFLFASAAGAQQFSDWSAPVNLGPVVNSVFDDQHMAISKDGLSLYFSSNRPGGCGGLDLWVTQRASAGDPWGLPQNLGCTVNSSGSDFAPNLSPDAHYMYFTSRRPGSCGIGDLDIYVSRRHNKKEDFGWRSAENLGCVVNTTFRESGPTYFEDDTTGVITLFFTCADRPENHGADICASTQSDGTFGPGVVVPDLSGPFNETRVAIRRDGLEIFFPSNRPGTFGNLDLWTSTRAATSDPWPLPVNMGSLINSSTEDEAPSLSFDGTELYFFSARPGGFGGRDLYVMTRSKLTGPQ